MAHRNLAAAISFNNIFDCIVVRCSEVKPRAELLCYKCEACQTDNFLSRWECRACAPQDKWQASTNDRWPKSTGRVAVQADWPDQANSGLTKVQKFEKLVSALEEACEDGDEAPDDGIINPFPAAAAVRPRAA